MRDRPANARTRRTINTIKRMVPRPMYMISLSVVLPRVEGGQESAPEGALADRL
jgi:hypothetical protein